MRAFAAHWRWVGTLLLIVAYACAAHYANTHAGHADIGTLLALAPLLLAGVAIAANAQRWQLAWSLVLVTLAALAICWPLLIRHYDWVFLIEHAGSQLFLCVGFCRTLRAGQEPMCSRFARLLHGELTPEITHYTRRITQCWAGFFGAMAAVSTLLFFCAGLPVWSVFANFFTAPLIAAMFIGEYVARHWLHPQAQHARLIDLVRLVYKDSGK